MADDTHGPGNGLLYALLSALCVVVAGGGFYIYRNNQDLPPVPQAALAPVAPTPQQAAPTGHSAGQISQARSAITDARHMAARGDFTGAEMTLQGADRVVPGFAETAAARRDIAEARTARGDDQRRDRAEPARDSRRIASLVDTARAAIARYDYAAADRALDEAEHIDARDPAVLRTRNELQQAAAHPAPGDQPNRSP